MNLVIVDGTINSSIETVQDRKRLRARFLIRTGRDEDLAVEVRGVGATRLMKEWRTGDAVQVRGRLGSGGFIAATTVRRTNKFPGGPIQEKWPLFSVPPLYPAFAA